MTMQSSTLDPSLPSDPASQAAISGTDAGPALAVTQRRVIASEWIKLFSVRSNVLGLAAAIALTVGLGLLFSTLTGDGNGDGPEALGQLGRSLAGFRLSQLIIGVLGIVIVTGEYSSGLIRTTFAAVVDRTRVLWAKAIVFGGVAAVLMTASAFTAFIGGRALYSGTGLTSNLSDPGVFRVVIGAAAYVTGVGVIGVGLGFLMRSTASAISVLFATLLLVPALIPLLPSSFSDPVSKVLPSNAGASFTNLTPDPGMLSATAGALVFLAWIVGTLALAAVLLRKRDA